MTINFPSNPSANDTYTYLSRTWIYTGEGWQIQQAPLTYSAVTNALGYAPLSNQDGTMNGELTISGNTFANKQFTSNGHANIANALIFKANITSANIAYANVTSMNVTYANIANANIASVNIRSTTITSANIAYALIASSNTGYANITSANIATANIGSLNIASVNMTSSNLTFANVLSTNIATANILSSNLLFSNIFSANIGTANVLSLTVGTLNVYNTLYVADAARNNIAQLRTESTGYSSLELKGNTGSYIDFGRSDSDFYGRILYNVSSNVMTFSTSSSAKMTINSAGYFSLGTVNAIAKMGIVGKTTYDLAKPYNDTSSFNIVGPGHDYPSIYAQSFGTAADSWEAPEIGFFRSGGDNPEVLIGEPAIKSGNTVGTIIWRTSSPIIGKGWFDAGQIQVNTLADESVTGGTMSEMRFFINTGSATPTARMILNGQYGSLRIPQQPAIRLNGIAGATYNFTVDGAQLLTTTYYAVELSRGGMNWTGGVVYVPVTGYYCILFQAYVNTGTYGNGRLYIHKNGATQQIVQLAADGSNGTDTYQSMVSCVAGDYIGVSVNAAFDASSLYMGPDHTTFHAFLLG